MMRWKRWVVLCLGMQGLLSGGCSGVEEDSPEVSPTLTDEAVPPAQGSEGLLVSPELFALSARWSRESLDTGGVGALAVRSLDAPAPMSLVDYARRHAPELLAEASAMPLPSVTSRARSALTVGCTCQVLATFDSPSTSFHVADPDGHWSMSYAGAAHAGDIYNSKSGSTTETRTNLGQMFTQFKTRMNCRTPAGVACAAGCTAKLYTDVLYSTLVTAGADTGGIWNKAASGQVADGATLEWAAPSGVTTRLFDKGASANHWASNSALDPQAVSNLVKGVLKITRSIFDADWDGVSEGLTDSTEKGLFALRSHSGANGSTSVGVIAGYETLGSPFDVSYASTVEQTYSLTLSSSVNMHARGYGGWHRANGNAASSYGMAAYVDNFFCDASVTTPPARSAFWRYDGYGGAYVSVDSLRERVGNFFYLAFGVRPDVSQRQGALVQGACGDGICGGLESASSCAMDCVRCGDDICSYGEDVQSCPGDCGYCGDYFCSSIETLDTCPDDCGWCGDGVCAGRETFRNCGQDCGFCGDSYCSSDEHGWCVEDCSGGPGCIKEPCGPNHL
ncbi:hypothetical protein [Myxococcus qinghaiensis]|uniref:hypothetical protein n=1 Tax=Myxococcus qinghaiensis TaxID=2906758 RepID=UPI0020A80C57|nr:hypothetical protein [Myxococcus qinghaiensis]MCP3162307.1 hypothetical protein [Myxococcus qinghaiensis]